MKRPSVLVLDDGELGLARELLGELGARFEHVESPELDSSLPEPEQLLVTTAQRAEAHQYRRGVSALAPRAVWIVFLAGDDRLDRTPLRLKGFDLLVREPVHPVALRLLLLRALYSGHDKRRVRREAFGYQVEFRSGKATGSGTLTDLSARGCRLFTQQAPPVEEKVWVQIPGEVAGGEPFELPGRVLRTGPATTEGGDEGDTSVGISFETLDAELRKRLRAVLIERSSGPAVLPTSEGGEAEDETPKEREHSRSSYGSRVMAMSESAAYALLGLDVSEGGMRVEANPDLHVGDHLRLAIHPRTDPFLVEAIVVRDDGERGLALRFEWVEPGAEQNLRSLVESLPMIEVLDDGELKPSIVSQILPRGDED